jgi:hypothetical protein
MYGLTFPSVPEPRPPNRERRFLANSCDLAVSLSIYLRKSAFICG